MNSSDSIKTFAAFGVLFTFILGIILHFTYELLGSNYYIGYFIPVNESVWEHLKLIFYAWVIYGIICYPLLKDQSYNYWLAIFLGTLCANLFIIIFFYTYSGAIGHPPLVLDILTFFIGCIIAAYIFYKVLTCPSKSNFYNLLGLFLLIITGILFAYFTYHPLDIPLFVDWGSKS